MNLFEYSKENKYSVYPEILYYFYFQQYNNVLQKINKYQYVFVASDIAIPMRDCNALQFMTSSETPDTFMWSTFDYSDYKQLPPSEFTDIPTVGFVGRCPILTVNNKKQLHKGFEPRFNGLNNLLKSNDICTDFHIRYNPTGDSAAFYNNTLPDYKKSQPLFKTNMLANQYQLCARGNANWSLRFYETLAYGRIPIYIESGGKTLGNLGCEKLSSKTVPFVYITDVDKIESGIIDFHNSIKSISRTQDECKEWYTDHYTFEKQIENFESLFGV